MRIRDLFLAAILLSCSWLQWIICWFRTNEKQNVLSQIKCFSSKTKYLILCIYIK